MLRRATARCSAIGTVRCLCTTLFSTNNTLHAPKTAVGGAARARRQQSRSPTSGGSTSTRVEGRRTPGSQPTRLERLTSSKASSSSSSSSPPPRQKPRSTTKSAAAAPMRGRFNRLASTKGLAFATYLYVLGEGMTLGLTCLLHLNLLGIGDAGLWLSWLGLPIDAYLNIGPTVFGVQLSPRLLLNYLVANTCCYPLYRFQYAFCEATAPFWAALTRPVRQALRTRNTDAIPKAPSPKSGQ